MNNQNVNATQNWRKGVLTEAHIVTCQTCGTVETSYAGNRQSAMLHLRGMGWGTWQGSWYCPTCIQNQPTPF